MLKEIFIEGVQKTFENFVCEFCREEDAYMKELCANVLISIQHDVDSSVDEKYENCKKLVVIMENVIEKY